MLAGLAAGSLISSTALAGPIDIVLVVDESGSMSTEHGWITGMVTALNSALALKGQNDVRFSLVGFGNGISAAANAGRVLQNSVTAGAFSSASLVLSGGTEDGYAGLNHAFSNVTYRAGSAQNFILITDEDRDNTNAALTFASIDAAMTGRNALLNVVVDCNLNDGSGAAPPPPPVLGITGIGPNAPIKSFTQNGATTAYNTHVGGGVNSAAGTTLADYIALAFAVQTANGKNGAAWDLNQLRAGGNTAAAFTNAFVDLKVEEIIQQIIPLPNAAWMGLAGLAGIGVIRRIRRK
jgi:hypothetical protein